MGLAVLCCVCVCVCVCGPPWRFQLPWPVSPCRDQTELRDACAVLQCDWEVSKNTIPLTFCNSEWTMCNCPKQPPPPPPPKKRVMHRFNLFSVLRWSDWVCLILVLPWRCGSWWRQNVGEPIPSWSWPVTWPRRGGHGGTARHLQWVICWYKLVV